MSDERYEISVDELIFNTSPEVEFLYSPVNGLVPTRGMVGILVRDGVPFNNPFVILKYDVEEKVAIVCYPRLRYDAKNETVLLGYERLPMENPFVCDGCEKNRPHSKFCKAHWHMQEHYNKTFVSRKRVTLRRIYKLRIPGLGTSKNPNSYFLRKKQVCDHYQFNVVKKRYDHQVNEDKERDACQSAIEKYVSRKEPATESEIMEALKLCKRIEFRSDLLGVEGFKERLAVDMKQCYDIFLPKQ